ncbi:MAG: DNA-directed RNA polymerase subunit A'' [Candidatus Aenigmarchaeota archaeon]|nr:DNA-directed RNA polymerase subunit A'' [Candidatus Aenigmarchaeota archaeon]
MTIKLPEKIEKEVKKYFEDEKIPEKERKQIEEKVIKLYKEYKYSPEEPVGVITAQSLSEPATQLTMRTYHFAGTAGIQVTLGLPRMIEIFDARKSPTTPSMMIYILQEFQDIEKVKKIAEQIKEVKVKDVVKTTTVDMTDLWVKCKPDMSKLKRYGIEMKTLKKKLKVRDGLVDVDEEENVIIVKLKKKDIAGLYKLKYNFLETHIAGIKGITQVIVLKEGDEWVINTLGSNLKKVFNVEGVDTTKTFSNDIFEIYSVLGIEAARNSIINEARYTMEEQGLGVDVRYVMILADLMTFEGDIRAIGRYGISGQKSSILVRASFEETKKHFIAASISGESDGLRGTVENIMMNQVAPIGTGSFELIGRIPEKKKK